MPQINPAKILIGTGVPQTITASANNCTISNMGAGILQLLNASDEVFMAVSPNQTFTIFTSGDSVKVNAAGNDCNIYVVNGIARFP